MPAKRTKAQRESDLIEIAKLFVEGHGYRAIAAELCAKRNYSLSHVTILRDCQLLLSRWRDQHIRLIDEAKAIELAKLSNLENKAWEAYEESRKPTQKIKSTIRGKEVSVQTHAGDSRHLAVVERCIARRCAILGLDAPTKIAPTTPDGKNPYGEMTTEELMTIAAELANSTNK